MSADIVLPPHPHKMVCPVCGLTRYLPDGWQQMMNSETIKCVKDDVVMLEGGRPFEGEDKALFDMGIVPRRTEP